MKIQRQKSRTDYSYSSLLRIAMEESGETRAFADI